MTAHSGNTAEAAERVHSLERPAARCLVDGKDFVSTRKGGVQ
jgi:hypothetical protein